MSAQLNRLIYLTAFVLAIGCSAIQDAAYRAERTVSPVRLPDVFIDPRLSPLLDDFLNHPGIQAHGVPGIGKLRRLELTAMSGFVQGEQGACERSFVGSRFSDHRDEWSTIKINAALAERPGALRWAVYHELGHCLLGLRHLQVDKPAIMNAGFDVRRIDRLEVDWNALLGEMIGAEP